MKCQTASVKCRAASVKCPSASKKARFTVAMIGQIKKHPSSKAVMIQTIQATDFDMRRGVVADIAGVERGFS